MKHRKNRSIFLIVTQSAFITSRAKVRCFAIVLLTSLLSFSSLATELNGVNTDKYLLSSCNAFHTTHDNAKTLPCVMYIKGFFNGLLNAYLISFFANLTSINSKTIEYQLKGLKDISGSYDFAALVNIDARYLWSLYKWVYEGSSVDKLGVTRNIIPLHVDDLLSVNEPVLASAYSSFILSQKDDVKSYIDATSKLADQMQVTAQKEGEAAEKVANSIKTGVFGVATFAISTILFRIFSKSSESYSYSDLFAFIGSDVFVLVIGLALFVFTSLFGFALVESFQDQKRFGDMYEQSKKAYENVLTVEDMKNILNNDKYFKQNNRFISKRRNLYILVWFFVLLAISITLMLASFYAQSLAG